VLGTPPCRQARSVTALADRDQARAGRQLARAPGDFTDRHVDRPFDVPVLPFRRRPHVDHLDRRPAGDGGVQLRGGDLFHFGGGQSGADPRIEPARNRSFDAIEADAQQLERGLLRVSRLFGQQDQRHVRRDDPAGPVADLRTVSNVERTVGMSRGKGRCLAQIQDLRAVGGQCRGGGGTKRRNLSSGIDERRPGRVDALHPREIRRGSRNVGEHGANERIAVAVLQHRVLRPLARDRGRGLLADAGPAQRSRAVAGMHLDPIVERHHASQRVEQIVGELPRLRLAEQIGAADAADEQQIAGEQPRRVAAVFREHCDVLRRVTGRVQERQRQVADRERLAIRHFVMRKLEAGARSGDDPDAALGELARAGDEVGVDVRLDRRDDGRTGLLRGGRVDRDVAPRIDHDRLPGAIGPDEKRRLRQTFVEEPLEHGIEFRGAWRGSYTPASPAPNRRR
jgi:hypothetical protein